MTELKDKIVDLLNDKQVENIKVINFKDNSPYLDYFVIGTVRNARMANATINYVEDLCQKEGVDVKPNHNDAESKWFLLDCGSVIVHLFYDGERERYDLEGLWKDLIEK